MIDSIVQPVSRDQLVKLAEGRVGAGERRQIVRRLVAQAARNQGAARLDPFLGKPVSEAAYDHALTRAFERACRLHDQLGGEKTNEDFGGWFPSPPATPRPSPRPAGRSRRC